MTETTLTNLDPETVTIGEFALQSPGAIAVLERWEIDYCCRGYRSVAEACRAAGVTTAELLAAVSGRSAPVFTDWQNSSLVELQSYLMAAHHAYTRQAVETIALLSEKVSNRHGGNHGEVLEVASLFGALAGELGPHLMKEENVLFPYVEELEAMSAPGERPASCFGSITNPIRVMLLEHDTAGDLLVRLRRVTRGYALPDDACLSFRALYEQLEGLEKDLHQHIHLENNVLFPRALALEAYR